MTSTEPRSAVTSGEQEALGRAFDQTPAVFRLLSTLRTRRMGLGYWSETGREETPAYAGGRPVVQEEGPLSYASEAPAVRLTELEEALIAWAAAGPNGIAAADVPLHGDLSSLTNWSGRTAPSSSNGQGVHLFIVNDDGVHLYKPGLERSAPLEIDGPEDYGKLLDWYRKSRVRVMDRRPDVGWSTAPPGTHNVRTMGALQYNLNRQGSTWFLPVGDVGLEWVNLLLSSYQFSGFYLQDPETDKPCGVDEWIKPGFLEVGFPIPTFDELALMLHASEAACMVQNIRLAAEAIGLGAWPIGGYSDDLLLGAYPEVARGLGFGHLERQPARNPSRTATCTGLPGIFDATMTPNKKFPTAASLVEYVANLRYGSGAQLSPEDNWAARSGGPFNEETLQRILEHPRAHIPDWVIEAATATVKYLVEKYGCAPAYINPVRAKFSAQVHHVDLGFYRKFYALKGSEPYLVTPQLHDHFRDWHPGTPDPSGA
ncbi:MAG: hypothetical protein HY875_04145 [Chloroflexi bacterium]|nr:hypothetical protein [Chloroflexota bacterium]